MLRNLSIATIVLASLAARLAGQVIAHGPVLLVNNSTGSDTAASGSGPAGAVSAVATCHTGGVASTTITWPANGFLAAGVLTGFQQVLWLGTAAGRRFSEINTYAAGTVTVEDTFNIPAGTPVDCAVGGKRATLAATQLVADVLGSHAGASHGWQVQIENTGASYTQAATLTATAASSNGCIFLGTGSPRPIISMSADANTLRPNNCDVQNLQFVNTAVGKTASRALDLAGSTGINVQGCTIGGTALANGHFIGLGAGGSSVNVYDNEIRFNTTGVDMSGGSFMQKVIWNDIHDNGTGVDVQACTLTNAHFTFRNLIINNTGVGVSGGGAGCSGAMAFIENVIDGNGSHGLDFAAGSPGKSLVDNQISNNGGFGVRCTAASNSCESLNNKGLVAFNNFFANTSGARQNWPVGESETAVDPGYVNRVGGNFCRMTPAANQGGPPGAGEFYPGSATDSFLERGACQARSGGGAGGRNIGI